MDVKQVSMVVMLMAACLAMVANAMSIPADSANDLELGSPDNKDLDERATWLDTRGLEEDFKELVYSALQELTNEHRISPDLVIADNSKQMKKRGRWQGFCFRRTRNGRFLPYICWKGDRK